MCHPVWQGYSFHHVLESSHDFSIVRLVFRHPKIPVFVAANETLARSAACVLNDIGTSRYPAPCGSNAYEMARGSRLTTIGVNTLLTPIAGRSTLYHGQKPQIGGPGSEPLKPDKPRPHICRSCVRSFARLEHLQCHERSHTKEKPFECQT